MTEPTPRTERHPPAQPPTRAELHALTEAQLRDRRTMKWATYPDDVLPMWVAEMDYPTAQPILAALRRAVAQECLGYPSRPLVQDMAEAFAAWHAARGWSVDPAGVFDAADVMHGVSLAIRHWSGPDDPVVIPTPVYMPFFDVVALTGRPQLRVPMVWDGGRWTLDVAGIDAALAAGGRTLLISSPHNPLGRVFDRDELASLATVVARHDARVVTDEIHGPLALTREHIPYATISPEAAAHSITVTSASKTWNLPGLKAAQVVTHTAADRERFAAIPIWDRVGVSTLGLVAQRAAYRDGDPWLAQVSDTLRDHARLVADAVATWPGVSTVANEGTYLQWLDFGGLGLDQEPADWLLREAKVALSPGVPFGGAPRRFARLNFATTRQLLEQGLERIARAVAARG